MTQKTSLQPPNHRLRFGPYEVDLQTQEFWKDGIRLKLARQPFQVLAMLLARPGELVTREQLQQELWPCDTFSGFTPAPTAHSPSTTMPATPAISRPCPAADTASSARSLTTHRSRRRNHSL